MSPTDSRSRHSSGNNPLSTLRGITAAVFDLASSKIAGTAYGKQTAGKSSKSTRPNKNRSIGSTTGSSTGSTSGKSHGSSWRNQQGQSRDLGSVYVPKSRLQRSSSSHNQTEFAGDSGTGQSGTSHRTERSSRHQASWTIPLRERPDFLFDEGQTSQLFNCLPTLISDSPGAALGTVIFLGMHQSHRYQGRALNDRTRLLTQFVPNPASLSAASEASLEMAGAASIEDILSADLTFYDQQFLLLASGQWSYIAPMKMVNELLAIAEQFVQEHHPHPRREASARIMAAAILMVELRDFTRANEEMVKAIALIGVAYPDATMIELAKSVNPKLVEQTVGHNQDRPDTAILTS